ncbi:MAG: hypothetical protein JW822_07005 [Spirochaetales bacterium]|nr:hypothetical protein [Spirochaetales bacterium]
MIPEGLKIPGLIFWGEKAVAKTAKSVAEFLLRQGWDITTWRHDGWNFVREDIILKSFDWLEKKIP